MADAYWRRDSSVRCRERRGSMGVGERIYGRELLGMTLAFILVWFFKWFGSSWAVLCKKGMDRSPRQQTLCNHHWENIVVILSSDSASMW
ncbi:hypothetical protein ACFXTO_032913 [Malus domestica]